MAFNKLRQRIKTAVSDGSEKITGGPRKSSFLDSISGGFEFGKSKVWFPWAVLVAVVLVVGVGVGRVLLKK